MRFNPILKPSGKTDGACRRIAGSYSDVFPFESKPLGTEYFSTEYGVLSTMPPLRINYLGLIPLTRREYLISTAGVAAFAAVLFIGLGVVGLMPPLDTMWSREHHLAGPTSWLYNYLYWVILVCLVAEAIDICVMLRAFARKEAEARQSVDTAAPPKSDSSEGIMKLED